MAGKKKEKFKGADGQLGIGVHWPSVQATVGVMHLIEELVSGLLGASLADWLRKLAPPRPTSKFDLDNSTLFEQWNRTLYIAAGVVGGATFLWLFLYLVGGGWNHDGWQIGMLFGFPFTVMFLIVTIVDLLNGHRQFGQFLRYVEKRQQIHIGLISFLYGPLVALGLISIAVLTFRVLVRLVS